MRKGAYKKKFVEQMKALNTYSPEYELAIDTLAQICELRDRNFKQWKDANFEMVTEYTNKNGSTNLTKTQYYLNNLQFNEQILKYIRELGLSPTALKRSQIASDEVDAFEEFMKANT